MATLTFLLEKKYCFVNLAFVVITSFFLTGPYSSAELKNTTGPVPKPGSEEFQFEYEFGPPIKPGEMTYNGYRKQHMEMAAKKMHLDAQAIGDGMDTWHWWVGVDNPGFWSDLTKLTGGPHNYTNLRIDLLRLLVLTPREERFKHLGLINDPDTVASEKPDQFGLKLDRMKDGSLQWDPEKFGYSSGVIGLQLFRNEKFDPKIWSTEAYLRDGKKIEPPYKVGMACVFCHIGFNPLKPPKNPEEPQWENLTSTIGNQYLREGMAFGLGQKDQSIIYHYLNSQEPGTSETSRIPTDSINNPTNISAILRLQERLKLAHEEEITVAQSDMLKSIYKDIGLPFDTVAGALGGTKEKPTIKTPHVLTDGADSLGLVMASVRVYVNEGLMHDQWYDSLPVNMFDLKSSFKKHFKPAEFDIATARKDPESPWRQTEKRMPNMAIFLMSYDSFPLADADGGKHFLSEDQLLLKEGKIVFAENCASCHSSKIPNPLPKDPEQQKKAWTDLVLQKDFLENNYLSDDERHSVLEIGTNAQRAEGSNAQSGWTWGQMSSLTYKKQREGTITLVDYDENGKSRPLYNPLSGKYDIRWTGKPAFYRTPTLVSIWATAPFLHNNSLGKYNADPSVKGRLEAFNDAMEKMLWPERRDGIKSIKVTTAKTSLPDIFIGLQPHMKKFDDLDLKIMEFPKGTPVNLVMNVSPLRFPNLIGAYLKGVLKGHPRKEYKTFVNQHREAGIEAIQQKLLENNNCPDFIEDRGHTFGSKLSDSQKNALTEYMKYF